MVAGPGRPQFATPAERPQDKAVRQGTLRNFSRLTSVLGNGQTKDAIVSNVDTDIAIETVSWQYLSGKVPDDTLEVGASIEVEGTRLIGVNPSAGMIRNIMPPIKASQGDNIEVEVFNDSAQDIEFEINVQAREIG